ncbi:MAG: hypothetical protein FWC27_03865 [Firmicutes bacterium]|nr:hypothetical protein [Bacillota bacterium]
MMKRAIALCCAALLLAGLCFSCRKTEPKPLNVPGKSAPLLTLYADTAPLRIVTKREGVTVTLQKLEYEPTVGFLRPVADEWEQSLTPGKEYEIDAELAENIPEYRLFVRQGENVAIHNLAQDRKDGNTTFEISAKPWAPAPVDENSPMIHLCRAAVIAPNEEQYDYWYAIANAITTLRCVDLELPPDDEEVYAYNVPVWLFEAYARALFPDTAIPSITDWMWIGHNAGSDEPYLAYAAYSTWIWAEYKSAKQNPDGTWEVTMTLGTTDGDGTADKTVTLAPNEAYDPDSPFEYHVVGMPEAGTAEPGEAPPDWAVGTWKAPTEPGYVCYLEIFADGTAGLYLGDDESDMVYEIYQGYVLPAGADTMNMHFDLDWYIYEGEGDIDVPGAYSGSYTFRLGGSGQTLTVGTASGDNLYGKKELAMRWIPKTLQNGTMEDLEPMG